MKKFTYIIIPLLSLAGPLAMSFDARVNFIQYLLPVCIAIVSVGTLYIVWDIVVTRQGHWRFNNEFVGELRLLHLPLGEHLFFLCIPYSCLFIYEVVRAYFGVGRALPSLLWLEIVLAALCAVYAIVFRKRGYTRLAFIASAFYFASSALVLPGQIFASDYIISFILIFIVFVLVNGVFTSLPTIIYNENEIIGKRFFTIPLEDFFYNLSYIGLVITVYIWAKMLVFSS